MCRWLIFFLSFPADPIDVLQVLELSENMEGVSLEAGLCTSRRGMEETDMAYKIDKKIQLSAPTKQLFPGRDFFFPLWDRILYSIASSPLQELYTWGFPKKGKEYSNVSLLWGILLPIKTLFTPPCGCSLLSWATFFINIIFTQVSLAAGGACIL